jgi:mono/diheme cytochrome c family protein
LSKLRTLFLCQATAFALLAALPALAFTGADTFKAKCAMCHAADGSGATPVGKRMNVRDLRSADVQAQTTEAIGAIITKGQKAMPAFGKSLSAEQIKDVVGYIRSIAAK